jgi:organic radical activating enzyme
MPGCCSSHVESSPQRTEMMTAQLAERIVHILAKSPTVHTVDLTGGAPELNSQVGRGLPYLS